MTDPAQLRPGNSDAGHTPEEGSGDIMSTALRGISAFTESMETATLTRPTGADATPGPSHESRIAVSAIIPCLNEEQTLALCIEKAFRAFAELGVQGEVVVADNGS